MSNTSSYDIELIDINEKIDNFSFSNLGSEDLDKIIKTFKSNEVYLEFTCEEGKVLLERKHFRGVMYIPHKEKRKTVIQETLDDAKDMGPIEKAKVASKTKPKVVAKD